MNDAAAPPPPPVPSAPPAPWKPLLLPDFFHRNAKPKRAVRQRPQPPGPGRRRRPPAEGGAGRRRNSAPPIEFAADPVSPDEAPVPDTIEPARRHRPRAASTSIPEDESSLCSQDDASVVSELTLMTYRDEQAEALKDAIRRRLAERRDLHLSAAEKAALLREAYEEQERKAAEAKAEEKERARRAVGANATASAAWPAARVLPARAESFATEATPERTNCLRNWTADLTEEFDTVYEAPEARQGEGDAFPPNYYAPASSDYYAPASSKSPSNPNEPSAVADAPAEEEEKEANLDELIELKLRVANQQATIDTLSSLLHNLEVAVRKKALEEERRAKALEDENRSLAERLRRLRHRAPGANSEEAERLEVENEALATENATLRAELAEAKATRNRPVESPVVDSSEGRKASIRTESTAGSTRSG